MNTVVFANLNKIKPRLFLLPLLLILTIVLFLLVNNAFNVQGYVAIQKDWFYELNHYFGEFSKTAFNLTQLGDASIFLSFIILLVIYAPKVWESLISGLLVSAILCKFLKDLFLIPRPAEILDEGSFIIIGRTLHGFSSLPSGHTITIFTILTIVMLAFMPKKSVYKEGWIFLMLSLGYLIGLSRVAVGAHFPLDVLVGSIVGFISALLGIMISRRYKIWNWICLKKFAPVFIIAIVACIVSISIKIFNENIIVFYLALISLFVALYKFIYVYFKK
ncbi:MAG: phosphatase PAP2 family protein [Flavobacterium sp.]|nr:phosphatase PAP2 family protein [Flavobacterium sp.]